MLDKRASRILAIQGIYDLCWNNRENLHSIDLTNYVEQLSEMSKNDEEIVWGIVVNSKFTYRLLKYCVDNIEDIDKKIKELLDPSWKFERVPTPALAVLRIGISELACCPNNPLNVIMSEFITISDMFVSQNDTRFIHALLDKVGKEYRPNG